MNKETILKEYKEAFQTRFEIAESLSRYGHTELFPNSGLNAEFSHTSYHLLCLLDQNLSQELKIIEMIAENEKIYEIYEIQREQFNHLTSTSEG